MYGCGSWAIRKLSTEELMLLNCGVAEDSWESLGLQGDAVHPKGNHPEYSLEGLMLKLKLQYFGHLMRRTDSLEKTLMLGKIEGRRRRGQQRMRSLEYITDSMSLSNSWHEFEWTPGVGDGQGGLVHCSPWGPWTRLSNWTERNLYITPIYNLYITYI